MRRSQADIAKDCDLLEQALQGLAYQRSQLDLKIREVKHRLRQTTVPWLEERPPVPSFVVPPFVGIHAVRTSNLSAAGRRRISLAAKRRWRAFRKSHGGRRLVG